MLNMKLARLCTGTLDKRKYGYRVKALAYMHPPPQLCSIITLSIRSESSALKKCDEKLSQLFRCEDGVGCWESAGQNGKPNTWIREKIGIPEEKGVLEQIKHRKLSKYCHWKRKSDSVVLATIEGEIEGKCFPGRRTAWIDDVWQWTGDDMNVVRTNAMERRYDCW